MGYSDYHLCLAHLVLRYPEYADIYASCVKNGEHVILDNGAAEGQDWKDVTDLHAARSKIAAQEVIPPDVIGDRVATVSGIGMWSGRESLLLPAIQGRSLEDWFACLGQVMELCAPEVVAVPKAVKRFLSRISLTIRAHTVYPSLKFHWLGLEEHVSEEVGYNVPEYVRGIDMKYPITAGRAGRYLEKDGQSKRAWNRKLDLESDQDNPAIEANIKYVLRRAGHGTEGSDGDG